MKNHHKNMDQQLRELENTALPNLSHIDQHWKKLEGTGSVRIKFQKPLLWVASIVIITSTILILTKLSEPTKPSPETMTVNAGSDQGTDTVPALPKKRKAGMQSETTDPTDSLTFLSISDTISKRKLPVKLYARKRIQPSNGSENNLRRVSPKKVLLKAKTSTGVDTVFEAISVQQDSTVEIPPNQLLDEFFAQIATPSQTFTIDNKYDTILVGRSGSLLFIPAGSFGDKKNVSFVLTEYYTREEFVCNRLVTISGREQLESAGMVRLEAFENGKSISLAPHKTIKWYVANIGQDFTSMELFQGKPFASSSESRLDDTSSYALINWIPRQIPITQNRTYTEQKVLDIRNTPYKTKYRKGGEIGYFIQDPNSVISSTELAERLKERFKYKKVFIKPAQKRSDSYFGIFFKNSSRWTVEKLGDSTVMDSTLLKFYQLESVTQVRTESLTVGFSNDSSVMNPRFNMTGLTKLVNDRYGFDLNQLGWINCDKFYRERGPKKSLEVEIGDDAFQYYTTLVFKKRKMALSGIIGGRSVFFNDIPVGEQLMIISVGIRNGKAISTIKEFVSGQEKLVLSDFTATDPASFKKKLSTLNH